MRIGGGLFVVGVGLAVLIVPGLPGCGGGGGGVVVNDNGDFLVTGRTLSHFQAVQVDPRSEDSAGPQFVVAEDLNADGLTDLVSAWNQSQPVQVHIQKRTETGDLRFETITLAGSVPVLAIAGLAATDLDNDNRPDVVVLVKHSAVEGASCMDGDVSGSGLSGLILTYFCPADPELVDRALAWREMAVGSSFLQGNGSMEDAPEEGGYSSLAVGDVDANGTMDIVVAWNSSCDGGSTEVLVFDNLGSGAARDGRWAFHAIPDSMVKGTLIKDVALGDIDRDGDLDVVATFPDAPSANIRWFRNPVIDVLDDYHMSNGEWQSGTVAQIATGADIVRMADIDQDGILDVTVRSANGGLIQWLKGPQGPTTSPLRSIPWQVYTLAEFLERVPESLAVGDVNFDGRVEVFGSAEGALIMLDSQPTASVYDQWIEEMIVDELPPGVGPVPAPATTDPNVEPQEVAGSTMINSILIVDVDGDGANDIVATFDRSGLSGLTNDALAWFRNIKRPPN
jgi:hypothetical protein